MVANLKLPRFLEFSFKVFDDIMQMLVVEAQYFLPYLFFLYKV